MINAIYHGHQNSGGNLLCHAISLLKEACHQSTERLKEQRHRTANQVIKVKKKAFQLGYKRGKAQAISEHCQLLLDRHLSYQKVIQQANRECLDLALTIAEEIIATQINSNSGLVAIRITKLLESLLDKNGIKIKVNCADYQEVNKTLHDLELQRQIKIEGVKCIEIGNAIIETVSGKIELDWRKHLEQLKQQLQSRLEKLIFETEKDEPNA